MQSRTYTYDGLGRVTSVMTPEAGIVYFFYTTAADGLCSGNPANVCRKTDARGITTTFSYDTMNRLTGKTYSDGTTSAVTYKYDQGGAAAFALGRLTQTIDSSNSEAYTYDAAGRITQVQKTIAGTPYTTSYQYNVAGQVVQISYPSGRIVQQGFDAVGRLCVVASQISGCVASSTPYATNYSYDAAGNTTGFSYGNNVIATFGYSPDRLQLSSISYAKGSQTLFNLNYIYRQDPTNCPTGPSGNNGQVQCIKDLVEYGRTLNYTYDALGRLKTAVTDGSAGYPQWGLQWNYDRYGNRLNQTQTAGGPPQNILSFAYPGGAQWNRPDGYSFDPAGNMLYDGDNTLAYDAENRMISNSNQYSGTHVYAYDSRRVRVRKCTPDCTTPASSTTYVFTGDRLIAEYDSGAPAGSPSREYIYADGNLLATITGGTTVFHHDHLSVRLNTDSNGNKIGEQGHYPYGEAWYVSGTTTKFLFTSYERDGESANDYAMARFYISRFGRFSSVDPVLGRPNDPQSWNRYAYARNDPINITDPTGQFWLFKIFKFIFNLFKKLFGFDLSRRLNLPKIGTPPTFPTGPGTDLSTLFFGKPRLEEVIIFDWTTNKEGVVIGSYHGEQYCNTLPNDKTCLDIWWNSLTGAWEGDVPLPVGAYQTLGQVYQTTEGIASGRTVVEFYGASAFIAVTAQALPGGALAPYVEPYILPAARTAERWLHRQPRPPLIPHLWKQFDDWWNSW